MLAQKNSQCQAGSFTQGQSPSSLRPAAKDATISSAVLKSTSPVLIVMW